jgi:protein-L-isoaspartate O-methyltransferase
VRIDPTAASGFSAGAAAYERGRPSYPDDAIALLVDELRLAPGRRVLDLAAGTGKMTALLAAAGADVVAVEPVAAMRKRLAPRDRASAAAGRGAGAGLELA